MTFYLDECVPTALQALLEADSHTVYHARIVSKGANDAQQFLNGIDRQAVLVTQNTRDFVILQYAWRLWSATWGIHSRHGGIIALPQWPVGQQLDAIRDLIAKRRPFDDELFKWSAVLDWHVLVC